MKPLPRASMLLASCALAGTLAICGAIFAQQTASKKPAPASPTKASASGSSATTNESQAAGIEARLPASVKFYVHWRGTKTLDAMQGKNGLLRLWTDPDFAPIRRELIARAFGNSWLKTNDKSIRPEQLAVLLPLFENEAIVGSLALRGLKQPLPPENPQPPAAQHMMPVATMVL